MSYVVIASIVTLAFGVGILLYVYCVKKNLIG
jgi:hypothetical protein